MQRNKAVSHNEIEHKNRGQSYSDYERLSKAEIKNLLRTDAKVNRDALTQEEIHFLSGRICSILQKQPSFENAEMIYFYYPLGSEASLLPVAEQALSSGEKVACPRVCGDTMDFYEIHTLTEFEKGMFGVMEPTGIKQMKEANALVLVPGLAFDLKGGRMGYGKGYYDRYLARYPRCYKIGICYERQIVPKVFCDPHDISMDALVTDEKFYELLAPK